MSSDLARLRDHYARKGIRIPDDPVQAVRELAGEVVRLRPDAEAGTAYRQEIIEGALRDGVRAYGRSFPTEQYRGIFERLDVEQVEGMGRDFRRIGDHLFSGGRRTRESAEHSGPRPRRGWRG